MTNDAIGRPIQPQNAAEVAMVDQKHAQIAGIVDRVLAQVNPERPAPAQAWLEFIEPLLYEVAEVDDDTTSVALAVASEALRRLAGITVEEDDR